MTHDIIQIQKNVFLINKRNYEKQSSSTHLVGSCKTGAMSTESCQTISTQLQNVSILMEAQCDKTDPCMCPNVIREISRQSKARDKSAISALVQRTLRKRNLYIPYNMGFYELKF